MGRTKGDTLHRPRHRGLVATAMALLVGGSACGEEPKQGTDGLTKGTQWVEIDGTWTEVTYIVDRGRRVWQGDILLGEHTDDEQGEEGVTRQALATITNLGGLWPDGRVPYEIDPAIPFRNLIEESVEIMNGATDLTWVPRAGEGAYVQFVYDGGGNGCFGSSSVGRTGGRQRIFIGGDFCDEGIVVHEMGHAIGLFHTHSRPDRDTYITILFDNIEAGFEDQFRIEGRAVGPYDVLSVMHYGSHTFARGRDPTIVSKTATPVPDYHGGLIASDIDSINLLYADVVPDPTPVDPCQGVGGDTDGDGVCQNVDNCTGAPNANQADGDDDGGGDACDPTPDGDPPPPQPDPGEPDASQEPDPCDGEGCVEPASPDGGTFGDPSLDPEGGSSEDPPGGGAAAAGAKSGPGEVQGVACSAGGRGVPVGTAWPVALVFGVLLGTARRRRAMAFGPKRG